MNCTRTLIAAFIVLAVITFLILACPSVAHNIVNDLICRR